MYNNYGYNYVPYTQQNRYMTPNIQNDTQIQTNIAQMPRLNLYGRQVDSIEMAKTIEYPLDGSISYYPITDGSAIVSKQMNLDGTPKLVVFKPVLEEKQENRYITQDDMKKALNELDFSELEDIKDDIKDIKQELKDLKKKGKINNE